MNYKLVMQSIVNELKIYDLFETLLFIKYQYGHNETTYTRQLLYRKKVYLKKSEKKKINIVSKLFECVIVNVNEKVYPLESTFIIAFTVKKWIS